MPLVTLPNHKTVEIPLDIYLLPDIEYDRYIQELMSMNAGTEIDSFTYNSSLETVKKQELDQEEEEEEINPLDDFKDLLLRDDI